MENDAVKAKEIVENAKGKYKSIPEVLEILDQINIEKELVEYNEKGIFIG